MSKGLFVTGTDTGIGKTMVSAALMIRYRAQTPCYWKPVQTGSAHDDDSRTVRDLTRGCPIMHEGIRLAEPLSPHLAARKAGTKISIASLVTMLNNSTFKKLVIEGAGGVFVPLNEREMIIDWIAATGLPALVVARNALGTINHTLLTIQALRARWIPIAGIVLVGEPNIDHCQTIEHFSGVPVLAEMPRFLNIEQELHAWSNTRFDAKSRLVDAFA